MIVSTIGPKRILVVEDNPDLAYGLRNNLEIEGYEVDVVEDGTQGLARARRGGGPDLIILDLMLPGMDGYRVLRALRDEGRRMPVLILTARGEESDKVRGLRLGADDYVTKPFGVLELLARVEALLRRTTPPTPPHGDGAGPPERFGDVDVVPAPRGVPERPAGRPHAQGVRPAARAAQAARRRREPDGPVARGVGLQRGGAEPHGGHARRRAAAQARSGPGGAAAYSHRSQGGLSAREVGGFRCVDSPWPTRSWRASSLPSQPSTPPIPRPPTPRSPCRGSSSGTISSTSGRSWCRCTSRRWAYGPSWSRSWGKRIAGAGSSAGTSRPRAGSPACRPGASPASASPWRRCKRSSRRVPPTAHSIAA